MVRPAMAAIVSSTKPASLIVSVWMATWTSNAVGHRQTAVDGGGSGAPILMEFQAAGAGGDLFFERRRARGVSLAEETEVHGPASTASKHARYVPRAGRAGSGVGAGGGSRAAADHGRGSVRQGFVDLLRAR